MSNFLKILGNSIKRSIPGTVKTCTWMVEMTVLTSFVVLLLRYFGILGWIAARLGPLFGLIGLPGEAALAYVSGYFVNNYAGIAVAVTLGLNVREMTILAVMVLCSHSMLIETPIQKMTGSKVWDVVLVRTLSGIFLGSMLHLILPTDGSMEQVLVKSVSDVETASLLQQIGTWAVSTLLLCIKMILIIAALNIIQAILTDFGAIKWISRFLKPFMSLFGLPEKVSFLWIIANVVGLSYGSAVMMEELRTGNIETRDIKLLNTHIGISHSNLEDLALYASIGAVWWILLLSRWALAAALVWLRRGYYRLKLV